MRHLSLIMGGLFFFLFSYEMSTTKTPFAWFALFMCALNWMVWVKDEIVEEIKKHIDGKDKNNS